VCDVRGCDTLQTGECGIYDVGKYDTSPYFGPVTERDVRAAFGLAVRRRRTTAGLSQESLAEAAQLERAYVSALERGNRNPTLLTQTRIAAALGVTLATLIEEAGEM